MRKTRTATVVATLACLAVAFAVTGGVYKTDERDPLPSDNTAGENLKLAQTINSDVPNEITLTYGVNKKDTFSQVHNAMRISFENVFGDATVKSTKDSDLILEITSLSMIHETYAVIATRFAYRYEAVLRRTANGEILRTAAGTVHPKMPMFDNRKRTYEKEGGLELVYEDIANRIFAGGDIVLPEIREAPPTGDSEKKDEPAAADDGSRPSGDPDQP